MPIIVVSIAGESGERVLSALDAGAVDFVQKPTALATEKTARDRRRAGREGQGSGRRAGRAGCAAGRRPRAPPVAARRSRTAMICVVIGISTGGPQGLEVADPAAARRFSRPGRDCPAHADRLH